MLLLLGGNTQTTYTGTLPDTIQTPMKAKNAVISKPRPHYNSQIINNTTKQHK